MTHELSTPGCHVVELRQYTLHAGQRDVLIDLFDREFVETQEAVGMTVMGQFRDLDDADRFSPLRVRVGARDPGWYVTEPTPNNFPRLPVREGEPVRVGLALFDSPAAFDAFVRSGTWAREALPRLAPWLARPVESHRLVPTARSALHA
ncbi:MAG TPA: hypothetical protein VFL86_15325 [Burkholderiaceae bacterium]|nr:hypothetical protein [Burkholderiaceae bacterium]